MGFYTITTNSIVIVAVDSGFSCFFLFAVDFYVAELGTFARFSRSSEQTYQAPQRRSLQRGEKKNMAVAASVSVVCDRRWQEICEYRRTWQHPDTKNGPMEE